MNFHRRFLIAAAAVAPLAVLSASAQDPAPETPARTWDYTRDLRAFNPALSAIVDLYYQYDDTAEGLSHLTGELAGFGHAHGDGEGGHAHQGTEEGFNLRHLELQFSAEVDPYFKGSAIAAIDPDGAEMETAEIETTGLPAGLKLRGGKFYSDFGYLNAQHAHQWDFADQPLIHQLTLGAHGLNDKGVQLSWLAPTPFYLLAGVEAFQGENELLFAHHGDDPLPRHGGPRVGVGWLKFGPNLAEPHALQAGVFGATGRHQEAHDGDEDGAVDHWLDGESRFWGFDMVYKYNAPRPYGEGDVIIQGEYFNRRRDLDVVEQARLPEWAGQARVDNQDGYYVQAVYGMLPRWRAGLRWEEVGLTNDTELPDGDRESAGRSHRAGAMVDFTPSEFSRLRLQVNHGSYETDEGTKDAIEVILQCQVSLGAHGAHKF